MSLPIQTVIDRDNATPAIAAKMAKCKPSRLARIVGPPLMEATRDHLKRNPRNRRGWPSTNFWERAARSTKWQPTDAGGVLLSVNQIGVRQRFYGGVIRARNARMLTIPISPEAYGKTAAEFPGAFVMRTRKGVYLVRYGQQFSTGTRKSFEEAGESSGDRHWDPVSRKWVTKKYTRVSLGRGRRLQATLNFLFKLKPSVVQEENRTIIPHFQTLTQVAFKSIEEAVK